MARAHSASRGVKSSPVPFPVTASRIGEFLSHFPLDTNKSPHYCCVVLFFQTYLRSFHSQLSPKPSRLKTSAGAVIAFPLPLLSSEDDLRRTTCTQLLCALLRAYVTRPCTLVYGSRLRNQEHRRRCVYADTNAESWKSQEILPRVSWRISPASSRCSF